MSEEEPSNSLQEIHDVLLSKIQAYIESRMIEGFDWNDFYSFLKEDTSMPTQTFEVRFQTYLVIESIPNDTWTLDGGQLDAGRLGIFEEYPSWRNYHTPWDNCTSRCYFRFENGECHKLNCFLDADGQVLSAEYRQCVHSVCERDLRQKVLSVWDELIWDLQYKVHVSQRH
jgi:hypothetical protein